MDRVDEATGLPTELDALFRAEFARLVRSLALVDGPEAAADAVQEAFIAADRRWRRVRGLRWWDGAWELWIDARCIGDAAGPIRVRWDTDVGAVVDVRTVGADNIWSSEEPGAPQHLPPDDVRYRLGD